MVVIFFYVIFIKIHAISNLLISTLIISKSIDFYVKYLSILFLYDMHKTCDLVALYEYVKKRRVKFLHANLFEFDFDDQAIH